MNFLQSPFGASPKTIFPKWETKSADCLNVSEAIATHSICIYP